MLGRGQMKLLGTITTFCYRHSLITILAAVAISLFFGAQMPRMTMNNEFTAFLPTGAPSVKALETINEKYGGANFGFILFEAENIPRPEVIMEVDRVDRELERLPMTLESNSIADVIGRESLKDPQRIEQALLSIKGSPIWNQMISEDEKYTLIRFRIVPDAQAEEIERAVNQAIEKANLHYSQATPTGSSLITLDLTESATSDMQLLMPLAVAALLLILFLTFRRISDVAFQLLVVFISLLWTIGTMILLGIEFTIMTMSISLVVIGIGIDYVIHLINRYYEERGKALPLEAFRASSQRTGGAIFLTMITSAIAFSSFLVAENPPIQHMGILLSLGVFFSFLLSITLLPAIYKLRDQRKTGRDSLRRFPGARFFLEKSALAVTKHKRILMSIIGVTILASFALMPRLGFSTEVMHAIESPAQQAFNIINEKFGGQSTITILVEDEIFKKLEEIEDLSIDLESIEGVSLVESVIPRIERYSDLDSADPQVLLQEEEIRTWASETDTKIELQYEPEMEEQVIDRVERIIQDSPLSATPTGMGVFQQDMRDSLVSSYRNITGIAALLILIVLYLTFRRISTALIAFSPMILVLIWQLGSMSLLSIPLSITTITCSAVIIGVGIDFSIHMTQRMKEEYEKDSKQALQKTIRSTGNGLLSAALTTMSVFLILSLSSMQVMHEYGLITALIVLYSLLAAIFFLPSVIERSWRRVYGFESKARLANRGDSPE